MDGGEEEKEGVYRGGQEKRRRCIRWIRGEEEEWGEGERSVS